MIQLNTYVWIKNRSITASHVNLAASENVTVNLTVSTRRTAARCRRSIPHGGTTLGHGNTIRRSVSVDTEFMRECHQNEAHFSYFRARRDPQRASNVLASVFRPNVCRCGVVRPRTSSRHITFLHEKPIFRGASFVNWPSCEGIQGSESLICGGDNHRGHASQKADRTWCRGGFSFALLRLG